MGNFQHLAQKVLSKNCPNAKVSCFLPLAEETGNFQGKSGNNAGNFNRSYNRESQSISAFKEETHKETSRKPEASNQETFAVKNHDKSFLISNSTAGILDGFFLMRLGWISTYYQMINVGLKQFVSESAAQRLLVS